MYIGFGSPLAVFIYHGFVKSIPAELEEAALIDGCTRTQTFFRIVFPVLTPTTVTICYFECTVDLERLPTAFPGADCAGRADASAVDLYISIGTYTVDYGPLMAGLVC